MEVVEHFTRESALAIPVKRVIAAVRVNREVFIIKVLRGEGLLLTFTSRTRPNLKSNVLDFAGSK